MNTLREAAQQALEAYDAHEPMAVVMEDLRTALAEPEQEQEPVAICRTWHRGSVHHAELWKWTDALDALPDGEHRLYTHPAPQRTEPVQEPVAYLWQHCETGRTRVVMPDQIITTDATWLVVGPLYLRPPQRTEPEQEPVAVPPPPKLTYTGGWWAITGARLIVETRHPVGYTTHRELANDERQKWADWFRALKEAQ